MSKRVLLLSLSGIGNFIMQSPAIEALKAAHPDWDVTVWVAPRGTKVLAAAHPGIDRVIEAPIRRSLLRNLLFVARLARRKFDIGIMLSPGQLWKGSAYMWLAGIPKRIAHQYPHLGNPHSSFLLTDTIREQKGLHDVDQNLNLLSLLDIPPATETSTYNLHIPDHYEQRAAKLLRGLKHSGTSRLVGIHPGSAPDFPWKRWPLENFAAVAAELVRHHQAHILIFGGPDEVKLKYKLKQLVGKLLHPTPHNLQPCSIIDADILTTAALTRHCELFLANDSGLMHLAAAAGARTFGLFGPTDEAATGPRGSDSHVIRAAGTKPVYNTETNYDLGSTPHASLLALTPQTVLDAIS